MAGIKIDDRRRLARVESYAEAKRAEEPDVMVTALAMAVSTGDAETAAALARSIRTRMLAKCDFVMMEDYPISEDARSAWQAYRQALRDIPEQAGFPLGIVWPERPA